MTSTAWSAHRRRWLLIVLAAIVLAAYGRSAGDRSGTSLLGEQSALAPVGTPPPVTPSPGCQALPAQGRRRVPLRRRTAKPPERPVPFFAARAGALPPTGAATVGGVPVPRGSRCLHHWATDEPVRDPVALASRLAAVFPQTGLWPVLWDVPEDGPDTYMSATGDPDAAGRLNPETVMRRVWADYGSDEHPFPGLARRSAGAGTGAVAADPFGALARAWPLGEPPETGWVLLLVPCNRPADIYSVLGPELTEVMSDDSLTAILRSWEERFGTVPTTIGPATLGLAVDAPPRDAGQALRLAAEHHAFAPESDELDGPAELPALAQRLRAGKPGPGVQRSRHFWAFGWPD